MGSREGDSGEGMKNTLAKNNTWRQQSGCMVDCFHKIKDVKAIEEKA